MMSGFLCKIGLHRFSRHYQILPLPTSDPRQNAMFKVCLKCGKWWRNRDPEDFKKKIMERS